MTFSNTIERESAPIGPKIKSYLSIPMINVASFHSQSLKDDLMNDFIINCRRRECTY